MSHLGRILTSTATALMLLVAVTGCTAVSAVDHVRGAAEAAAALVVRLQAAAGVANAAARYNPADANGDIVFIRVAFSAGASPAQWNATGDLLTSALTGPDLRSVRQKIQLTVSGTSPARMDYGSLQDGQGRPSLGTQVRRWTTLRRLAGVPLAMIRSAGTGTALVFRTATEVDSKRFIQRATGLKKQLDGIRVEGFGFSGFGPTPAGLASVYQRMLAAHPALDQSYRTRQRLPAAGLSWSDRSWKVTVVALDDVTAPPAVDVALAAALQDLRAPGVSASFSWLTNTTGADLTFAACPKGHLTAQPSDRRLAAKLSRAGHPLGTEGGPGICA